MKRHVLLEGTFNIRDLGGYAAEGGETLWRSCLRGDSLHRVDKSKIDTLVEEGVRTLIDLRTPCELHAHPSPFEDHRAVCYHHVPLNDGFLDEFTSLPELYIRALTEHSELFAKIMLLIAGAGTGAVLFHCTTGKDRTGLIAALLLANVGVDDQVIAEDYALTGPLIEPLQNDFLSQATYFGFRALAKHPLLECKPEAMLQVLDYLSITYGSASRYLIGAGLPNEANELLRKRLLSG